MKKLMRHPIFSDKKRFRLLRIIIGCIAAAVPFIIIFRKVDLQKLSLAIHEVSWWTIPVLALCSLAAMTLQGIRWWMLIRAFTRQLSMVQALSVHFKSLFYSLFLSNSTVQEVIRSVVATRHIGSVISWASAWVNKITGIAVSFAFSIVGITLLPRTLIPQQAILILWILFLFMVAVGVVSFSKTAARPFATLAKRLLPKGVALFTGNLYRGIYEFRERKKHVAAAFFVTMLVQLSIMAGITLLIKGITGQFLFMECMAFMPIIEMISMAQPFTPNGIGVRDALVAIMFAHLGLTTEQLSVYIVLSNLTIVLKLSGALPVLVESLQKRQEQPGVV